MGPWWGPPRWGGAGRRRGWGESRRAVQASWWSWTAGGQAQGHLPASPDWWEGPSVLRSQERGMGEEDWGVLGGVCWASKS